MALYLGSTAVKFGSATKTESGGTETEVVLQSKTVSPSTSSQTVLPDDGYNGLSQVTVNAITTQTKTITPSTSVQTVSPDDGYDGLNQVTVSAISTGSLSSPSISVSSGGVITATSGVSTAGYLSTSASKSNTKSLTTQSGKTVTPSTSTQTAVSSGRYTTGAVYVAGDSNLVSSNIKSGVSIFGVAGSYSGESSGGESHIYNGVLICTKTTLIADIRYVGFDLSNAGGTNNLIGAFIRPNAASESLASDGLIAAFADIENSKLYQVYGTSYSTFYSTFSCSTYSTTYDLSNGNLYIPSDVLKTTYDNVEYLITPIYKT